MAEVDVLVAGAGPVGLTLACALRRHGVECRIIDRLESPPRYAKAVGIQPRTIEVFEDLGLAGRFLDEAIELRGQIVFVNGEEVARTELTLPLEVPYRFAGLPQYATESLLSEHLAGFGTAVQRGVELGSFTPDEDGVTAILRGRGGEQTVRARYLVGADGAHSIVRTGLGLSFEGDAFPAEYMLADVELDWSFPRGLAVRSLHQADGETDDILVCIPLPGRGRYRVSMLVAPDLATPTASGAEHGLRTDGRGRRWRTSRQCWIVSPQSPRPRRTCAGRRSSGSATVSSTATAWGGPSWPATPRTSTRRSARRG